MNDERRIYVHRAILELRDEDDPREPGAAVTVALCGAIDHPPPCRWPNNNQEPPLAGGTLTFRTVFVAPPAEEAEVRRLIEDALRAGPWRIASVGPGELDPDEQRIGERMAAGPREWPGRAAKPA